MGTNKNNSILLSIRKFVFIIRQWRLVRHIVNNRYIYITLICIVLPIFFYWLNFGKYGISESTEHWGTFGDYIGGCCSLILAFLALVITRKMDKKDRRDKKKEDAVEVIYEQLQKILNNDYDARYVNKLLRDANKYRLYLSEDLYVTLEGLCDYFLKVNDGTTEANPKREEEIILRLKSSYNE